MKNLNVKSLSFNYLVVCDVYCQTDNKFKASIIACFNDISNALDCAVSQNVCLNAHVLNLDLSIHSSIELVRSLSNISQYRSFSFENSIAV